MTASRRPAPPLTEDEARTVARFEAAPYPADVLLSRAVTAECPLSERVDGPLHSWLFDGDAPYVICVYCDRMQDAHTGRVIREGRTS